MSGVEQEELKQVVKEAIKEIVTENSEALKDLLVEVLDDLALLQRMEEGRESELVGRDEIMGLSAIIVLDYSSKATQPSLFGYCHGAIFTANFRELTWLHV
jgi:hypothetical protein